MTQKNEWIVDVTNLALQVEEVPLSDDIDLLICSSGDECEWCDD